MRKKRATGDFIRTYAVDLNVGPEERVDKDNGQGRWSLVTGHRSLLTNDYCPILPSLTFSSPDRIWVHFQWLAGMAGGPRESLSMDPAGEATDSGHRSPASSSGTPALSDCRQRHQDGAQWRSK